MPGYIHKIKTKIPYSSREVNIDVQGKNLIFTGGNGCGKTQLLNYLYETLKLRVVDRQNHNEQDLLELISHTVSKLETMSKADSDYRWREESLQTLHKQLEESRKLPGFISDIEQFVTRYHEQKAILSKFNALRQADIKEPKAVASKEDLRMKLSKLKDKTAATLFEEYLVSHKIAQAYAESPSIDNNPLAICCFLCK